MNFNSNCHNPVVSITGSVIAITLTSCSVTTDQYEATQTTYTWQVKHSLNSTSDKLPRFETFASTSLLNRNGLKPEGAVTEPDEWGLWWTALPPRPTVDVEQRQRPQEKATTPELLKAVEYQISFELGNEKRTLLTNHQVYRQVVKAYPQRIPLQLTLGVNDNSVEKAELNP